MVKQRPLGGKFPGSSPYVFALDRPTEAIDPDGRVILFINGQHNGEGGQRKYWEGYDEKVRIAIGDKSTRYIDGALGGWTDGRQSTLNAFETFGLLGVFKGSNVSLSVRINQGRLQGYNDAADIIKNLGDDESIKIVTHSMGTGYARGYVEGIMKYAQLAGLTNKVKFEYELDVNAFQGKSVGVSPYVKRTDDKTGGLDGGKSLFSLTLTLLELYNGVISVPTVAQIKDANNTTKAEDADKGHSIGKMSTDDVPHSNHNSKIRITIEEGVNNQASPITNTSN